MKKYYSDIIIEKPRRENAYDEIVFIKTVVLYFSAITNTVFLKEFKKIFEICENSDMSEAMLRLFISRCLLALRTGRNHNYCINLRYFKMNKRYEKRDLFFINEQKLSRLVRDKQKRAVTLKKMLKILNQKEFKYVTHYSW